MDADRVMEILRAEYAYWRDQEPTPSPAGEDEPAWMEAVRMGAMGAVANAMAAVAGRPAPWHREPALACCRRYAREWNARLGIWECSECHRPVLAAEAR